MRPRGQLSCHPPAGCRRAGLGFAWWAQAYVRVTMRGSAVPCEESALPPSSGGMPHCSAPLLLRRNCRGDAAAACSDSTLDLERDASSCAAYPRAQPQSTAPSHTCSFKVLERATARRRARGSPGSPKMRRLSATTEVEMDLGR